MIIHLLSYKNLKIMSKWHKNLKSVTFFVAIVLYLDKI